MSILSRRNGVTLRPRGGNGKPVRLLDFINATELGMEAKKNKLAHAGR
jgi:hypothetical protein